MFDHDQHTARRRHMEETHHDDTILVEVRRAGECSEAHIRRLQFSETGLVLGNQKGGFVAGLPTTFVSVVTPLHFREVSEVELESKERCICGYLELSTVRASV